MNRWTEEDSRDLDAEIRAMRRPVFGPANGAMSARRWPVPKRKSNGRWFAAVTSGGRTYKKTCDTYDEAAQFIATIKGRSS